MMATRPEEDEMTAFANVDGDIDEIDDEPISEGGAGDLPDEGDGEPELAQEDDAPEEWVFGDEEPAAEEPEGMRAMRKQLDEYKRELAKERAGKAAPTIPDAGPMPKIDDDGIDYDADLHTAAMAKWMESKAAADKAKGEADSARKAASDAWQAKLGTFAEQRAALKVPNYDEAEAAVAADFNERQISIIVGGANNKAAIMYAIGRNPTQRARLAKISDEVEFAVEIGRMEAQLKQRRPETAPERKHEGNAATQGGDRKLDALEREAARTGDRSKIIAYKYQARK